MTPTPAFDLSAIKAMLEALPKGPWIACASYEHGEWSVYADLPNAPVIADGIRTEAFARAIASLPETFAAMVQEIERLNQGWHEANVLDLKHQNNARARETELTSTIDRLRSSTAVSEAEKREAEIERLKGEQLAKIQQQNADIEANCKENERLSAINAELVVDLCRIELFCLQRAEKFPLWEQVCGRVAEDIRAALAKAKGETSPEGTEG